MKRPSSLDPEIMANGLLLYLMFLLLFFMLGLLSAPAQAERIKDVASVAGVRSNQLMGYGLVVGLEGSGDKVSSSPFTQQSLKSMMTQLGIAVPPGTKINPKNVAAVMVHADLPAFAKPGQRLDITVSSVGDAKSLRGGSLLMTPLKGADGKIYAVAQGNLVVGGLASEKKGDGGRLTVNQLSAGRIPGGASVERMVANPFNTSDILVFNLHRADFTTAKAVTEAIDKAVGKGSARPIDATSISVPAPKDPSQRVSFMAMLENLEVTLGEAAAKVIINSRTGTVVINSHVRVTPAAVTHGSMTVTIAEDPNLDKKPGDKTVPAAPNVTQTGNKRMFVFNPGVTLNEVVRAVNQVGAAPSDLVAILEALKQAGALQAELVVI